MLRSYVHPCSLIAERKGWIVHDPWIDDTGFIEGDYDDGDESVHGQYWSKSNRERQRGKKLKRANPGAKQSRRTSKSGKRERVEARDGTFRCRQCKTMVGAPLSGGRHRNHCPLCLYSRHVDLKSPGDRRSDCRSMMEAIGLYARPNGEQVLVHECRGCGVIRHNRVAADDNVVKVMRLPVVAPEFDRVPELASERSA